MVKRIYNIVLQSAIGDGPTPSSETFFYDWSQLPDVPYYLTFSFASSVAPITQFAQMAMLYVDLAQSNNQIARPQSSAQSSATPARRPHCQWLAPCRAKTTPIARQNTTRQKWPPSGQR